MTTTDHSISTTPSISNHWQPIAYMVAEVAACYPIIVLLDAYLFHTHLPVLWACLLLCAGGLGITMRIAGRRSIAKWKLSIWFLIWIGIGAALFGSLVHQTSLELIWIASLCIVLLGIFRGHMLVIGDWDTLFPLTLQFILLAVAWIFYVITGSEGKLNPAHFSIYSAGAITLFSILIRCGSRQIHHSVWEDGFPLAPLRAVIRRSRRWTWILIGVIAVIGGSGQLSIILSWLWQVIQSLFQPDEAAISSQMNERINPPPLLPPMDLPEQSPSILNAAWIERIAQIVMIAAITAFVIVVSIVVYRLMCKYGPPLWRWLLRILGIEHNISLPVEEQSAGYIDQTEKINPRSSYKRRTFKKKIPDDATERVRYYYAQLIRRGIKQGLDQHQGDTPNTLGNKLIDLNKKTSSTVSNQRISILINWYNQIRYGSKTVDSQELQSWESKD